jgi:endoglucanase
VREIIRDEVADFVDEIRVDAMGNLICRKGSGGPKVMVAAHMDEIGLMVSHIDKEGYLRIVSIGGVRTLGLQGSRVRFENGTIGSIYPDGDTKGVPKLDDMYVDVSAGAENDDGIGVGDVACFWQPMAERGEHLVAKSMDDRVGCAVAIEALRKLDTVGNEVYVVFTVQEEVGLRGARPAAFGLEPDIGISVDVTLSADVPKGPKMEVALGKGAAIKVRDGGHIVPPAIKNLMVERAEAAGIPYQLEVLTGGTTDAAGIQLSRAGIPSGCISIPTRYVHSVSETVHAGDVQACIDLLAEMLREPIAL